MKKYLIYISAILLLTSCREEIDLNLNSGEEQLVVEGKIEQGFPPYIILTKSQGYFEPVNSETYNSIFVEGASVWVYKKQDSVLTDSIELTQITDSIPLYTNLNTPTSFSEEGFKYLLKIDWNEFSVEAITSIPYSTPLDSLWVTLDTLEEKDFKCDINALYNDPDTIGNNILIMSKRKQHWVKDKSTDPISIKNKEDESLLLVDCGPDVLINGSTFETYFPRPNESGFPNKSYNTSHFKIITDTNGNFLDSLFMPNDEVLIKFCQVDKVSMQFWRAVVRDMNAGGNPFAEPMNMVSNIEGGLGIWSGYGAVYYKIPVIVDTTITQQYQPNIFDIF